MILNKVLILLSLLFLFSSILSAEKMEISIRFLGLKVVKVTIVDENSMLNIHAASTSFASIASKMDNTYKINYSDKYLPINYTKKHHLRMHLYI